MNILFTPSDNSRTSGAFLCMVALIVILRDTYGHNVTVVLPYEGNGKELLDECGIRNTLIPSYTWTTPLEGMNKPIGVLKDAVKAALTKKNAGRIAQLIEENDIDVVHNNTSWGYIGALAALETKTPLVWHIQEFLEEDQARRIRWQKRGYALMARSDRVLAISESIYDKYAPIIGDDKLELVLDGIDAHRYECADHEILAGGTVRFLLVGGGEYKGHSVAIKACLRLLEHGCNDFELVLLGNVGEAYRERLQALYAAVPGAAEHFVFPGPTDDTPAYYAATDIFLMCSRAEAFGRVTVEAMMGGCLAIGANTAGTKELIEDGVTGYLFEAANPDDLARKIEYALEHKEQSRALAEKGQAYMLQNMTAEANAAKVNRIYEEILLKRAVHE